MHNVIQENINKIYARINEANPGTNFKEISEDIARLELHYDMPSQILREMRDFLQYQEQEINKELEKNQHELNNYLFRTIKGDLHVI